MTRILVTGGSGRLGSELTRQLADAGYTARVMSRAARKPDGFPDVEWAQADLETLTGLVEAVQGVDVVINAASNPAKDTYQVDVVGTEKLLEQARAAGAAHVIQVSIVGIDRMQAYPYYAQKLAAEQVVRDSGMAWTIVRITQFHDLIDWLYFSPDENRTAITLPTDYLFQTIDVSDAAKRLVEVAGLNLAEQMVEAGGPEVLRLGEMAQIWLDAQGLQYPIVHQDRMDVIAEARRAGYSTSPDHRYGTITWAQWVRRKYGPKQRNRQDVPPESVGG